MLVGKRYQIFQRIEIVVSYRDDASCSACNCRCPTTGLICCRRRSFENEKWMIGRCEAPATELYAKARPAGSSVGLIRVVVLAVAASLY